MDKEQDQDGRTVQNQTEDHRPGNGENGGPVKNTIVRRLAHGAIFQFPAEMRPELYSS